MPKYDLVFRNNNKYTEKKACRQLNRIPVKIKKLILQGKYEFRRSAEIQLANDGLTEEDAVEAILNAAYIAKKNSRSQDKLKPKEKVYIIESFTSDGVLGHAKGVIRTVGNQETFYVIILTERSTLGV